MSISLPALLGDVASLTVEEKRRWTDESVEVVCLLKESSEWDRRLESILGPALKPAGKKPTSDIDRRTAAWGGVRKNQTFYEKSVDGGIVVALIWPWQDGERFTLKMSVAPV